MQESKPQLWWRAAPVATLAVLLMVTAYAGPDERVEQSWVDLFNGKDLDDWVVKIRGHAAGENFANTFRVEDGLLTVTYDGYEEFGDRFGHLFYKTPYSHYRLRIEYRFIGEPAVNAPNWAWRNSGVMMHSQDPLTMPDEQDFPISLEFQFLGGLGDNEPRPTANVCTPGTHIEYRGELADSHCVQSSAPTFDGDRWVSVEVLVLGDTKIVHFVEGEVAIEYAKATYGGGVVNGHRPDIKPDGEPLASGFIALQSEGHPIQFRRVALLNLKGCMEPSADTFRPWYVEPDPVSCKSSTR